MTGISGAAVVKLLDDGGRVPGHLVDDDDVDVATVGCAGGLAVSRPRSRSP